MNEINLAALVLAIFGADIISLILHKRFVNLPEIGRRLPIYFGFMFVFSLLYAAISQAALLTTSTVTVMLIGFSNAIAAFAEMFANRLSLTRTSIFQIFSPLLTITLGLVFLNETHFLNLNLIIGLAMCFGAAFISSFKPSAKGTVQNQGTTSELDKFFLLCVLASVIIYSGGQFSMRYLAVEKGITSAPFLVAWYGGSFIGACFLRLLSKRGESGLSIPPVMFFEIACLGLLVWSSRFLNFVAYSYVPIVKVVPLIFLFSYVAPIVVGMWIYDERKSITRAQIFALVVGCIGGVLVILEIATGF